jgi:dimethylaniline monooxygenase (N-oxide forming)
VTSVCVIGAGISGLVTARTLQGDGFDVTILERRRNLGGVWDPDVSYPGVTTQTVKEQYAFSELPMPADWPDWPSGAQVHDYLRTYAQRFGVAELIHYGVRVTDVRRDDAADQWVVSTASSAGVVDLRFDKVVVCTGVFCQPCVPALPGAAAFESAGGRILHSSQVLSEADLAGKNVAIVGFQKSATDVAMLSSRVAESTNVLYRTLLWKLPKRVGGLVHQRYLLYSRMTRRMLTPTSASRAARVRYRLLRPFTWLQWRTVEAILNRQNSLKKVGLYPDRPIDVQIGCALSEAPDGYYKLINDGVIQMQQTDTVGLDTGHVVLHSGHRIPSDVVVLATGWSQTPEFLGASLSSRIVDTEGNFRLYRNVIAPGVEGLGFIGFGGGIFCQLTAEVGAAWLSSLWRGRFELPEETVQQDRLDERINWLRDTRPDDLERFRNTCVAPFEFDYLDDLLKDMGLRTRRTHNAFWEMVKPLNPADYAHILEPVRPAPAGNVTGQPRRLLAVHETAIAADLS